MSEIRISVIGRNRMLADGLRHWMVSTSHIALTEALDEDGQPTSHVAAIAPQPHVVAICVASPADVEEFVQTHRPDRSGPPHIALVCDPTALTHSVGDLADRALSIIGASVTQRDLVTIVELMSKGTVVVDSQAIDTSRTLAYPTSCKAHDLINQLTAREREILGELASRRTNREIADRLHLAEKTVRNYVSNILRKLEVDSRIDAGRIAATAGHL